MRVIDDESCVLGVMGLMKALELARGRELDLVEVAPNAQPPVCKFMDYGKYLYRQQKADRKHRAQQKHTEVKGIRIGFRTSPHDIEVKAKQARKFLGSRHVIKVSLILRGREFAHKNLAYEKMRKFYELLQDIAKMEETPKSQGNTIFMILSPLQSIPQASSPSSSTSTPSSSTSSHESQNS